jgi:hypothetical protein
MSNRDTTSKAYDSQGNEVNLDDIRQEDRDQLIQDMDTDQSQDES